MCIFGHVRYVHIRACVACAYAGRCGMCVCGQVWHVHMRAGVACAYAGGGVYTSGPTPLSQAFPSPPHTYQALHRHPNPALPLPQSGAPSPPPHTIRRTLPPHPLQGPSVPTRSTGTSTAAAHTPPPGAPLSLMGPPHTAAGDRSGAGVAAAVAQTLPPEASLLSGPPQRSTTPLLLPALRALLTGPLITPRPDPATAWVPVSRETAPRTTPRRPPVAR